MKGDIDDLIERIRDLRKRTEPSSVAKKASLLRIVLAIEARAKLNIQSKGLIDTGRLINSINHLLYPNEAVVGSFGVPYAAVHEFGFKGPVSVAAHRRTLKTGAVQNVRTHVRQMNVRARPYLRPAYNDSIPIILEELKKLAAL